MKQAKEKYQAERQRARDRVARREAQTTLSVLGEVTENISQGESNAKD